MTSRVFSLTTADATQKRRLKFMFIGGAILVVVAVVIVLLAVFIPRWAKEGVRECRKRSYEGMNSFVCVCTADHCDDIEETGDIGADELVFFLTSRDHHRMKRHSTQQAGHHVEKDSLEAIELELIVNQTVTYQSVMGFGGAFSDAVGILLSSLNPKARMELLNAYFHRKIGIGYTIGRVPIASTDFSTRIYSYADIAEDFDMHSFALAAEDLEYKIPYILAAKEIVGEELFRLYASPWSAPWWMKEGGKMQGTTPMKGTVLGAEDKYYRAYAKYLRLFFEEYAKRKVLFWGLTLQNEPGTTPNENWWQGMVFGPEEQRQFAYHLLSPELMTSEVTKNLKIMAHDAQRREIGDAAKILYANKQEASVIDGLAVHWYSFDSYTPLQAAHAVDPEKFIIASEASCGDQDNGEVRGPQLGNWTRGWSYGHDIIADMSNWVVGWTDWNLCLDLNGGPNWYNNTIDAAIIVNATAQEFYKQPLFYFLGHFSHFVPQDSVRILSSLYDNEGNEIQNVDGFFLKEKGAVEHIAFRTPDGQLAVVILNGDGIKGRSMRIRLANKQWHLNMPADSIVTAILKP